MLSGSTYKRLASVGLVLVTLGGVLSLLQVIQVAANREGGVGQSSLVLLARVAVGLGTVVALLSLAIGASIERSLALKGASRAASRQGRARARAAVLISIFAVLLAVVMPNWEGIKRVQRLFLQPDKFIDSLDLVAKGFWINIKVFVIGEILVLIWGLLLAVMRMGKGPAAPLRWFAVAYIDLLRGVPAIVTISLCTFGIPLLDPKRLGGVEPLYWALLGLVLCYGAYVAEVYRAGIESIHASQIAAARSLGLSNAQSMRTVVIPQAIRRVLPPLLNDFISLQKDSALVGIVGILDAYGLARNRVNNSANFTPYLGVAFAFVLVTIPMTRLLDWIIARQRGKTLATA